MGAPLRDVTFFGPFVFYIRGVSVDIESLRALHHSFRLVVVPSYDVPLGPTLPKVTLQNARIGKCAGVDIKGGAVTVSNKSDIQVLPGCKITVLVLMLPLHVPYIILRRYSYRFLPCKLYWIHLNVWLTLGPKPLSDYEPRFDLREHPGRTATLLKLLGYSPHVV